MIQCPAVNARFVGYLDAMLRRNKRAAPRADEENHWQLSLVLCLLLRIVVDSS